MEVQVLLPAPKQNGTQSGAILFWCSMRTRRHCAIFFHEGRTLSPCAVEFKSALGAMRQGVYHAPQKGNPCPLGCGFSFCCEGNWFLEPIPNFSVLRSKMRLLKPQENILEARARAFWRVQVRTWRYAPRCLPRTKAKALRRALGPALDHTLPPQRKPPFCLANAGVQPARRISGVLAQQAKWGNPLFAFPFIALTRLFECDIIKAITQGGCDVCFWKWISDQRSLGKAHR